ncbi:MAG: helix-turn-helix transcriptional regulator [Candidatus Helarchaeota archaeon]
MIKRIKNIDSESFIIQERDFLEKFESEILRGISKLLILAIIDKSGTEGAYGYQIIKDLKETTNETLIIEDGTLYPILKKLVNEELIFKSKKQEVGGRLRGYYKLTAKGRKIYYRMTGFLTKLIGSIAPLLDIDVLLKDDLYLYCPKCSNKIDIADKSVKFCEACGFNIEDYKRRINNE